MTKNPRNIVNTEWTWTTESATLNNEVITAGACVDAAKTLHRIESLLARLVARMDALHGGGLLEIVREEAKTAKRRRAIRLGKQRRARAARKATDR